MTNENKKPNQRLVAIDLGNGNLKLRTIAGVFVGPSQYMEADNLGGVIAGATNTTNIKEFFIPALGNKRYLWGPDLNQMRAQEASVETRAFQDRYKSTNYKTLFLIALAYAIDEDLFNKDDYTVNIVAGMPTDDVKRKDNRDEVKQSLIGDHVVYVDNRKIQIHVLNEDSVQMLPQSVGTLIDCAFSDSGENIHPEYFSTAKTTIVDCGNGTKLFDQFILGRQDTRSFQTQDGAYQLATNIAHTVNMNSKLDITFNINDVLRMFNNHKPNEPFILKRNERVKQDITDIVKQGITKDTQKIIDQLKNVGGWDESEKFLVTGGGSNLVDRELLDKFLATKGLKAEFIANPLTANVNGYYKYYLSVSPVFRNQELEVRKHAAQNKQDNNEK